MSKIAEPKYRLKRGLEGHKQYLTILDNRYCWVPLEKAEQFTRESLNEHMLGIFNETGSLRHHFIEAVY